MVKRCVSCPCSSVILFSIHLMGLLIDLACILAVSLMAICVKCRSRGNTPAAMSTASVPAVLGRPRQRHSAFLCILVSLVVYLLHCQTTAPYSIISRTKDVWRRISLLVETVAIPLTSRIILRELLAFLDMFFMWPSKVSCSSKVKPRTFGVALYFSGVPSRSNKNIK